MLENDLKARVCSYQQDTIHSNYVSGINIVTIL